MLLYKLSLIDMSSNRTFMELKLEDLKKQGAKRPVLIVPLWN